MIDLYRKQGWWTVIFLIIFSRDGYFALTLCPTATWQRNASTVAGVESNTWVPDSLNLNSPTNVYIDNQSNLYVLDANNDRVQFFPSNSSIGTTIINAFYGPQLDQFESMYDMSIDSNGSIYILDGDNGRVTKWLQDGSTVTLVAGGNGIGSNTSQINGSTGMFIDFNTMTIWIADTDNHRIVKWSSPTASVVVCGSYGSNNDQFMYPGGLFVDTNYSNTLYIADSYNHRIQMWLPRATNGSTVAGITSYYGNGLNQLWLPNTLIIDNNRNMFIVDSGNSRIMKWSIGASFGVVIAGDLASGTQANQLNSPFNINFDSSGSLYVADFGNNRIQKFVISCQAVSNISTTTAPSLTTTAPTWNSSCSMTTWSSNATTIAGSPVGISGSTSSYLSYPYDVSIYNSTTFYVADPGNNRIQRFVSNSLVGMTVINGSFGSALNQFYFITSINVDPNGNVYILDMPNMRVTKWTPGATIGVLVAGGNGYGNNSNQLAYPYGMFIETNTSIIWIADTVNSRIVRWTSPSNATVVCGSNGTAATQFQYPYGLYVDTKASNTLYVADTSNHRIQMWLPGYTNGTTVAGQTGVCGTALNQLCSPTSLTGDQNGNIYIADTSNNRIMRWTIGLTAGTMVGGSATYGVLPSQLNYPSTVKLDPNGALIVADSDNNRIQKFSVSCVPSTITTTTTLGIALTSNMSATTTRGTTSITSSTVSTSKSLSMSNTTMTTNSSKSSTIMSTVTNSTMSSTTVTSKSSMIMNSSSVMITTTTTRRSSTATADKNSHWLLFIISSILIFHK